MSRQRPNILFVLTDQQPATAMSCTGNQFLQTPAMDSLAAAGTRFDQAYCTNPVCLPSRFSLMTGRYPSALGIRRNGLRDTRPVTEEILQHSLGQVLVNAGYEAAYGGKVHLPEGIGPEKMGFTYVTEDSREELATVAAEWIRADHHKPWCFVASFINPHDICYMAIRDSGKTENERRLLAHAERECTCLDEALTMPAGVGEEEFYETYCPPLPGNFEPQAEEPEAIDWLVHERSFRQQARQNWTNRRWRQHRYALHRLTERVDKHLETVLAALRNSGAAENTVIIFTSDHGDMDASHRMEHKTALYEEAVRVPLIISQPGTTRAGVQETRLVSNGLDLIPTVCDYAGVEQPAERIGRSLRPLAEGRAVDDWRRELVIESQIGRAVVVDEAKYVRYDFGEHAEQLYDRRTNPDEMWNDLHNPDDADILDCCREYLQRSMGRSPIATGD